jgi:hypothetical protein
MGISFRSHNLGFKGSDKVGGGPGRRCARFGLPRAIYIWQSITIFLRPNGAIGTRGGTGDKIASVEANFFLLIFLNTRTFSNTRGLDHNTRTLGNFATS